MWGSGDVKRGRRGEKEGKTVRQTRMGTGKYVDVEDVRGRQKAKREEGGKGRGRGMKKEKGGRQGRSVREGLRQDKGQVKQKT